MIFIFISNTSIDIFSASSVLLHFFFSVVGATTSAGAADVGGGCGGGDGDGSLLFGSVSCYFYAFEIFGSFACGWFYRNKCDEWESSQVYKYTKMLE